MRAADNHYRILGLGQSATAEQIEGSLWRLADRAMALQHTAPGQSDELWLRIRQIRRDLLSGDERRTAYDAGLQPAEGEAEPATTGPKSDDVDPLLWFAMASAELNSVPDDLEPVIASRAVKPTARSNRPSAPPPRLRRSAADAGIALAVMALVAVLLIQPWNWKSTAHQVQPLALSVIGVHQGTAFASGQTVRLRWSPAGHAAVYRLQIARESSVVLPFVAFADPWKTILTTSPSYRLHVAGAQLYYWRVQALTGGVWRAYSAPRIFAVARPRISRPAPLLPRQGSIHRPGAVRVCWSGVSGARSYRLGIDTHRPLAVFGTCTTIAAAPGSHHWSVAAVVQAARAYTGPRSSPASFVIRRPRRRVKVTRHVSPVTHSSSHAAVKSAPTAASSRSTGSGVVLAPPITVASASLPRRTSSAHRVVSHSPAAHRVLPTRHARRHLPVERTGVPSPPAPPPPPPVGKTTITRAPVRNAGTSQRVAPAPTPTALPTPFIPTPVPTRPPPPPSWVP